MEALLASSSTYIHPLSPVEVINNEGKYVYAMKRNQTSDLCMEFYASLLIPPHLVPFPTFPCLIPFHHSSFTIAAWRDYNAVMVIIIIIGS